MDPEDMKRLRETLDRRKGYPPDSIQAAFERLLDAYEQSQRDLAACYRAAGGDELDETTAQAAAALATVNELRLEVREADELLSTLRVFSYVGAMESGRAHGKAGVHNTPYEALRALGIDTSEERTRGMVSMFVYGWSDGRK